MKKIVIIGASGHGKVAADIALKCGYTDIVFLDDNISIKNCGRHSVVGSNDRVEDINGDVIVAIGNSAARRRIQESIEEERLAVLIHPDAVVAEDVTIGSGTVVMAGTVINPGSMIGRGCIINTCASVDHDCKLGDYVHVAVGAHLAGSVEVGDETWIGAGATVSNNIEICGRCMIGAGAVVVKDIEEAATYLGVPARQKQETGFKDQL
jgi:sugar O-acyltransferase (sialic acid O-acetyltransferase NeuD family)